ncbi:HD domain-containing protein [Eubacteriales bacterium OttesenSCG-928-N14]|nr:HD domain-containing protein [Eubacteriales bacterium OttesenSCG-928-N14]
MQLMDGVNEGQIEGFCMIKSIEQRQTAAGKAYLALTLSDAGGQVEARLWDYDEDLHGGYQPEDIVKIRASLAPYKGQNQLRIERIRPMDDKDDVDMDAIIPSAPEQPNAMFEQILERVHAFADDDLKCVVLHLLNKKQSALMRYPAAYRLHHAYRGGLLHHMISMMRLARGVCQVYPYLDEELIISGILLHDIAKVEELDVGASGIATGYTESGLLLGHIPMGVAEVHQVAEELGVGERTRLLLEHIMLSHHGVAEYGSTRQPMFPEAEVVSTLDLLDARLFEMRDALAAIPVGGFSNRVWSLDNRQLYQHGREKIDK